MVLAFLTELTSLHPEIRQKVFKTELLKVFMTVVFFNFFTLCLTTWLYSLRANINWITEKTEEDVKN
jgi:hypothetical protein